MRAVVILPMLLGCGPVRLGDEPVASVENPPDAAALPDAADPADAALDAGEPPSVSVSVRAPEDCARCYELVAEPHAGNPPYAIEWEDGSTEALRRVCPEGSAKSVTVTVRDASSLRSAPHVTNLTPAAMTCPPEQPGTTTLCLRNTSFEGTASTEADGFDAPPWSLCTNPMRANAPKILNERIAQPIGALPAVPDGETYVGMFEQEQVSQKLCDQVAGGAVMSFSIDIRRLNISGGFYADTEQAYLEIWGGYAVNCSSLEFLWASPLLALEWQTFCVTARPQYFMDNLVLRARSDQTLATPTYLLVDHIVPVAACPKP